MLRKLHIPLCIGLLIWGCHRSQEQSYQDHYSGVLATIGIPQDAQGRVMPDAMANIRFDQDTVSIDTIEEGKRLNLSIAFTNSGNQPLVISDVRSHCGCTAVEWPQHAIPPGESDQLEVVFNSEGQRYSQNKTIFVTMNGIPNIREVYLSGYVKPRQ